MNKVAAFLLMVMLWLIVVPVAFAAGEGAFNDSVLSDEVIDQRIRFIEERLQAVKLHSQVWYWSWIAINGGAMIGNGIAATNAPEESDRVNYISQAALGGIGMADLVFRPLNARLGAAPIRHMPDATREEKLAKLHVAENLLHSNSDRAAERYGWKMHFANFFLNTLAGLATGFAGDWGTAGTSAAIGILEGEIFIWSQPGAPEADWKAYQEMASPRTFRDMQFFILPYGRGLVIQIKW